MALCSPELSRIVSASDSSLGLSAGLGEISAPPEGGLILTGNLLMGDSIDFRWFLRVEGLLAASVEPNPLVELDSEERILSGDSSLPEITRECRCLAGEGDMFSRSGRVAAAGRMG